LGKGKAKPLPINISLHGPHVDVVLVWLVGVWLVELESVALSKNYCMTVKMCSVMDLLVVLVVCVCIAWIQSKVSNLDGCPQCLR